MNNIPLISVIIPTFNRANLVVKTINSFLMQKNENFEIIVVDDGSEDNTEEIVHQYLNNRIRYYKKNNEERGRARNFGAKFAKGSYLNFFDSDDIAYSNHIECATNSIKQLNFPEVFHLSHEWIDNKGILIKKCISEGKLNNKILKNNLLSCNGVFIKNDIFKNFFFSENRLLSGSEDWELWLRLSKTYSFFGIKTITSGIVNHNFRSMKIQNLDKIIIRMKTLIETLKNQKQVFFTKTELDKIKSESFSLISLNASLESRYKLIAIKYLIKSLRLSLNNIFSKRFIVIIKQLFFFKIWQKF